MKLNLLLSLIGLSIVFHASAQDDFSDLIYRFKRGKVSFNRDGSVTFKKLKAHNGKDEFPIRYDGPRDLTMACQLMGYDAYLPELGLNDTRETAGAKLMFEKQGSLADHPVMGGSEISKLTCYKRGKMKSSIHAKVKTADGKSTIFSDIYFLRGDLEYRIAFQDQLSTEENFNRVCKLLDKKDAIQLDEATYTIINRTEPAVIVDQTPKFDSVIMASSYISRVECLND